MKHLSIKQKLINHLMGIKYTLKNSNVNRKEALSKLNEQPIDWWFNEATDIIAKTTSGVYVTVVACKAGINIKYMGVALANEKLMMYWNKNGTTCSTNLKLGGDLNDYDIKDIVDFTPIVKDTPPDIKTNMNDTQACPNLAFKANEMNEKHVEQIRKFIKLLDEVLSNNDKANQSKG